MLKVQEFLRNGGTLEALEHEPYNLFVRRAENDGRVLLKYSPASPKNDPICQECRGLILDEESNWEIVCRSFNRFFNAGEEEAATLSGNLRVYEKVDGSICRFYYFHGEWYCASMTGIDASKVWIDDKHNFFGLVLRALAEYGLSWTDFIEGLDTEWCYTYELATQDNIVVVPHEGYHLYYLNEYNVSENREYFNPDGRVECCKVYNFFSLEEVQQAATFLGDNQEGFVVVDENWNRVKVKGDRYFKLHFMLNNGKPDYLTLIFNDGKDEFLSYFPRFAEGFAEVEEQLADIEWYAELLRDNTSYLWDYTRKDFAASIDVTKPFQSFIFRCYEDHSMTWKKFTENWDIHAWERMIERVEVE
jgi:hypothetical protein